MVDTDYFSFLDDDDEYLPGAIDRKLAALDASDWADLAVSNGYRARGAERSLFHPNLVSIEVDPLSALFDRNWLASCGGLFRTSSFPAELFDELHPFAEWTWLAYRLAVLGKRVVAVDEPGFVINDTQGSLSKSAAFQASYFSLYERMLAAHPPRQIAKIIRERIGAAWHDASVDALRKGDRLRAVHCHLRSILQPGGTRYLTYTRRLLLGLPAQSSS